MQGTAGIKEDVQQPPHLCTVCETKVCHTIVCELQSGEKDEKQAWLKERCGALQGFCARLGDADMDTPMWRGLEAWATARLDTMP